MKVTKNYVESRQLHREGYSHENRSEPEGNVKAPSNFLTSKKKQDDRIVYNSMLLEKILDRTKRMNKPIPVFLLIFR